MPAPTQVTVEVDHYRVRVMFGQKVHLQFLRAEHLAFQGWVDVHGADYSVEHTFRSGARLLCKYDSRAKWEEVLAALSEAL